MKNTFAEKLVELRREKDWSQVELAKRAELSRLMIIKYEQGTFPTPQAEKKLTSTFGLPEDYFKTLRESTTDDEHRSLIAKRIRPLDIKTFRRKLLRAVTYLPEDQLLIELMLDQVEIKYDLKETIDRIQTASVRKRKR